MKSSKRAFSPGPRSRGGPPLPSLPRFPVSMPRVLATSLAVAVAACSAPSKPPPQVPAEIHLVPGQHAPELRFVEYGAGLSRPRWSHTADAIGGWLYVVGGADGEGQMASVERAPILASGDLGAFRPAASSLRTPRDCHASLTIGSWLYVFGGDRQGSLDSVERAPILSGGDLGDFKAAGTRLMLARDEHTATRIGRYVYVIGGIRGPVQLDSVERAEIRADGSLGDFTRYGRSLTAHRYGHWVVVHGNHLYVVGGLSDNGDSGEVERARITPDGELEAFERIGVALRERRDSPIAIILNGWLYAIAGAREHAGHIKLSSIEAAPLTEKGLGSFVEGGALQVGRDYHTVTRVGNWLYAIAGEKTGGGAIASVERARIPSAEPGPIETPPEESPPSAYEDPYEDPYEDYD